MRSFENGRHVSPDTTRMASHAFRMPKLKVASLPPAIAISASPARTMRKACPMAWLDDEHAVDTVHAGPVKPEIHGDVTGAGIGHGARDGHGMDARFAQFVDVPEALVLGGLAADAGSGHDGAALAQFVGPHDAGIRHGFARRHGRELREAIDDVDLPGIEMRAPAVAADLSAVAEAEARDIRERDLRDAAAALAAS